ncbi:MAG: hypothetical protein ABI881_15990 [Betaproteobacteria bacterium]
MKSLGSKPEGLRPERMMLSPLWSGESYRNVHPITLGLRDRALSAPALTDFLFRGERRVPRAPLPSMDPSSTWRKAPSSGLRATWLGHSTVLIEIDGVCVP